MTDEQFEKQAEILRAKRDQRLKDVDDMKGRLSDPYLRDEVLKRVGWWLGDVESSLAHAASSPKSREMAVRMATHAFELADGWTRSVEDAMRTYGDDVQSIG